LDNRIDLVILAGGLGSRIKKYLKNIPKPLIKINGKPFLQYLLQALSIYNFKNIYLLCGYRSKRIFSKFHNKEYNFVKVKCIKENKPLGTGGCLKKIQNIISNEFIVINGDTFLDINFNNLINYKLKKDKILITVTKKRNNAGSKKLINLRLKNKKVVLSNRGNYFNAGVYKFNKKFLNEIPNHSCSLENDILKEKIFKKKVLYIKHSGFFIDIGTPDSLKSAGRKLKKNLNKPAIFLDRDGTINKDSEYVHKKKNFIFRAGVISALKFLTKKKFYIFIITNQAGLAKKKFTLAEFYKLHIWLKTYLLKKGIFIHSVEYCPFHKNAIIKKYKKNSGYRKPGNLMIEKIKKNWEINSKKSYFIGDKKSDELAALKSKIKFYYTKKNLYQQIKELLS